MSTINLPWPLNTTVTLPEGIGGMLLALVIALGYILLSIDGATLVMRGTRDYIHNGLGKSLTAGRVVGAIGGILIFIGGWAPVLSIIAYLGGVPIFGPWRTSGKSETQGD